MKIALAQTDTIWENKSSNMSKAEKFISEAAKEHCDIIVFPEMSLTGFSLNIDKISEAEQNSQTISFFSRQALKNKIYIMFNAALADENGKIFNKTITVDDYGNVISSYAKIHPYSHGVEAKYFTGGDRIEWFNLKGATVSPFICYDMRFPEIFQIASQKSRLIIVSASWPDIRSPQYDILIRARAIETQSFIAIVNRVGHEMKYNYNGHSQIVSPDGNVISTISESETLITAEFDINYADVCRHNFSVKSDRRPDLYKKYFCYYRDYIYFYSFIQFNSISI